MWVLLWVITSMTYGPTRSTGSQVFHSLEACQQAGNFLKTVLREDTSEKRGASVQVACVEDN